MTTNLLKCGHVINVKVQTSSFFQFLKFLKSWKIHHLEKIYCTHNLITLLLFSVPISLRMADKILTHLSSILTHYSFLSGDQTNQVVCLQFCGEYALLLAWLLFPCFSKFVSILPQFFLTPNFI